MNFMAFIDGCPFENVKNKTKKKHDGRETNIKCEQLCNR